MIRFRKLLCPVDFFPGSLRAFNYALKLAQDHAARVLALHVIIAPVIPAGFEAPVTLPDLRAGLEKESMRLLKELKVKATKAGIPMEAEVKYGDIDVEIRKTVEKKKADLVVMGTHGRRGIERWFMGSVTERLMRHCPVPLLVIGGKKKTDTSPPAIRSILVTTDFSDGTADALAYAFSIAQECRAKINVLHVVDDLALVKARPDLRTVINSLRKKLERLVPDGARSWCDVTTTVKTGTPFQVILKTATQDKVGLLVMNIHGKGMWDRALVGSTAERVVRGAECPVMLIPPATAKSRLRARKGSEA